MSGTLPNNTSLTGFYEICRCFHFLSSMYIFRCFVGALLVANLLGVSCGTPDTEPDVILHTERGDIGIRLFDDTPKHKANFLKLAQSGYFDGMTFHRIIAHFMIQSGDPSTRPNSATTQNNPGYTLPAEITMAHAHTAGALGAARENDEKNPQRNSSGSQFYLVTGKTLSEVQIDSMEQEITFGRRNLLAKQFTAEQPEGGDFEAYLQKQGFVPFRYTAAQRKAYQTLGGSPWLDDAYTVFGEVVSGLEVIYAIGRTPTLNEVPQESIRITRVSLPNAHSAK